MELFFAVMAVMVALWFGLMKLLFGHLERKHPQSYDALGRPSLFRRNTPEIVITFMRFLLSRQYRTLHDPYLSRFCSGMVIFFYIYIALFIGAVLSVLYQTMQVVLSQ
jgi:hypothetical protein